MQAEPSQAAAGSHPSPLSPGSAHSGIQSRRTPQTAAAGWAEGRSGRRGTRAGRSAGWGTGKRAGGQAGRGRQAGGPAPAAPHLQTATPRHAMPPSPPPRNRPPRCAQQGCHAAGAPCRTWNAYVQPAITSIWNTRLFTTAHRSCHRTGPSAASAAAVAAVAAAAADPCCCPWEKKEAPADSCSATLAAAEVSKAARPPPPPLLLLLLPLLLSLPLPPALMLSSLGGAQAVPPSCCSSSSCLRRARSWPAAKEAEERRGSGSTKVCRGREESTARIRTLTGRPRVHLLEAHAAAEGRASTRQQPWVDWEDGMGKRAAGTRGTQAGWLAGGAAAERAAPLLGAGCRAERRRRQAGRSHQRRQRQWRQRGAHLPLAEAQVQV